MAKVNGSLVEVFFPLVLVLTIPVKVIKVTFLVMYTSFDKIWERLGKPCHEKQNASVEAHGIIHQVHDHMAVLCL